MRKLFGITALLLGLTGAPCFAVDCICAKFPSYQVEGGWLHYALIYPLVNNVCGTPTPTSLILAQPTMNQNCGPNCGTCNVLGQSVSFQGDLYFDSTLKRFDELDEPQEILGYVRGSGNVVYDSADFVNPQLIALTRTVQGVSTPFHAVVWRMQPKNFNAGGPMPFSMIGFEIASPAGPVQATAAQNVSQAAASSLANGSVQHTPIPGLIRADVSGGTALIRLNKSTSANAEFADFQATPSQTGTCSCSPCQPAQECCPPVVRCRRMVRLMRRGRCCW